MIPASWILGIGVFIGVFVSVMLFIPLTIWAGYPSQRERQLEKELQETRERHGSEANQAPDGSA